MNEAQFIEIIKAYQNLIYKICCSYCQDSSKRKDLEQEIFLQLWHSFKKYDGRVKLCTWIYKVALNTAIYYYRNDSKHNKKIVLNEAIISFYPSTTDDEQQEKVQMLYQFINQLNEMDKAMMLLYLDNNKQRDIAEILGISETNVATKISRIKKMLKDNYLTNKM